MERPIIFSTEMVRAILEGRKTQTRRVIKPQGVKCYKGAYTKPCNERYTLDIGSNSLYCGECGNLIEYSPEGKDYCRTISAHYQPGDTLWVRETWYYEMHMHELTSGEPDLPSGGYSHRYIYKASYPDYSVNVGVGQQGWRPSIHMPREAARIFLIVKSVRVDRAQNITDQGCEAEGVRPSIDGNAQDWHESENGWHRTFRQLWDSINAKRGYGWDVNPWCWVIEFERREVSTSG